MTKTLLLTSCVYDPARRLSGIKALLLDGSTIARFYGRVPRLDRDVRTIDLRGKCIVPGFIDSHTHLLSRGLELQYIDLSRCTSFQDCLDRLRHERKFAQTIFGVNWDESLWKTPDHAMLSRNALDRVSTTRPVIMRRVCGHCAVVNTAALRKIPRSWTIVDRKKGWLYEDAALYLNDIFRPDRSMEYKAIELGTKEALCNGITSIHEIGGLHRLSLLQHAQRSSKLGIRVAFYVLLQDMDKLIAARIHSGFGDDFLKVAGVKVFMDGSIGARTAALSQRYRHTRSYGKILLSKARLVHIVRVAEQNDLQLMIHTIGDRTTDHVLSVLSRCMDRTNRLRHRLEHLEMVDSPAIRKIARLHLIASMQPNFVKRWQQPGGMYERVIGTHYRQLNPFRILHRSGVKLAFGSDCMPVGPLYGIDGACSHPSTAGRVSRSLAFRAYTSGGAFATGDEKKKGRLKEGMVADLAVLNRDPRTVNNIAQLYVTSTFVAGKRVYNRKS
jgi:predicted amidohydrolase YtcJ